jgi:homoserine dehydrogenase
MTDEGRDYATVLADAQAAGYAEADPSGDVEGHDAVNKLVILARLAFGAWLPTEDVVTIATDGPGTGSPGITGVSARDIAAAAAAGSVVKLIANAARDDDDRIVASVLPTVVPAGSAFGRTSGVLNRIEIEAEPVGTVAFAGPGAGGAATSSAVLGDLIAVARGLGSTWAGLPPARAAVPAARASVPS